MDDPNNSSSSSESQESQDSESDTTEEWNILINEEKNFWKKELINRYFYIPKLIPKCKKDIFRINEKNNIDIINPFYLSCTNKNCKYKKPLRFFSFFRLYKTLPCSIIYFIIIEFIIMKNNATQIYNQCKLNKKKSKYCYYKQYLIKFKKSNCRLYEI